MKNISIIVAIGQDGEIGKENQLLWHISNDLKRFKQITSGKTVVMGRKTWFSLPKRPLPNRRNIVLSHDETALFEGAEAKCSIEEVLKNIEGEDETFIIGGAAIYQQFMTVASKLYVTHVEQKFEADTWFPVIDDGTWRLVEKTERFFDDVSGLTYYFAEYQRL